ncbi:mercuric reductase [Saccharothrix sp. NRRL B-16348]|uniref:mercury(II) reductase n=1 Tax=Saccharothrix sp. NRRL B-16348 TaxID=1415542 RepID=UPI0006ADBE0E|nr:mercury(II) reductase [Saccharothrix sp. NRRL B-16348]KOX23224.1 mercuric reductase [Saccharothrix sp. NRRL B-16348]
MRYDLAVIGSGGAAFAAAIAARRKGRTVIMIERGTVGGTCVNTGCVPSKALLAAAKARHIALRQHFPGIRTTAGEVDMASVTEAKRALVDTMRTAKYVDLAADLGWEILTGSARFVDGPAVDVDLAAGGRTRVDAEHYLVATGSTPWTPPITGLTAVGYLTSTTAMELTTLPRSLLVIGGNHVGLEQAQLFARLGTRVTVVEQEDRLAPGEEPEISAGIERVLADEGIAVQTGSTVSSVRREDDLVIAGHRTAGTTDDEIPAQAVLVATGRRPVTDGLGLADVGVEHGPRGEVPVDENLRTQNPRIWAAGDVTGHPQYVYVAAAHGTLVADNALDGARRTLDYHHLPRVTFTSPQIAAAGLTEAQAIEQGHVCECRVLPLEHVPRALVDRNTRGLIKLVAERHTGRLLGAHVLADGAGDVISTAVYALANHMTVTQMADMWCPYLTMAEGIKLAAQTFTRDVTKLSCCAS